MVSTTSKSTGESKSAHDKKTWKPSIRESIRQSIEEYNVKNVPDSNVVWPPSKVTLYNIEHGTYKREMHQTRKEYEKAFVEWQKKKRRAPQIQMGGYAGSKGEK